MSKEPEFYICTVCFDTSDHEEQCHVLMIPVNPGEPGDDLRKPLIDQYGRILTHAPRWFLKAKQEFRND